MKKYFLIIAAILITALPLFIYYGNENAEFGGADGKAMDLIADKKPEYKPWLEPLWTPPSGEIESMLFALQAAIGMGILCFGFGYFIGINKASHKHPSNT